MSAAIVITIVSIISPIVSGVCEMCDVNDDCYDSAYDQPPPTGDGVETCQDFGGDFGNICYWTDDTPSAGEAYEKWRICTTDLECSNRFSSCVRCCPNEATAPDSLCTATISPGKTTCGVVNEYIGRGVHAYYGYTSVQDHLFPDSPCCDGEECLDNIAGVCGVPVNDECGKCTMWSYLIGEEQSWGNYNYNYYNNDDYGPMADLPLEYTTGDNCGDGLVCVKDSSSDSVPYQNEFHRRLQEDLKRRLLSSPFLFNFGFCVPDSGTGISEMDGVCTDDEGCPSCMRCCKGKCMRATGEFECGIEGRGPCCSTTDICSCNQCVTPTEMPTPKPTKEDDDDDDDSDSNDNQAFGAQSGAVNDINNDIKPVKYTVRLNGGNLNNLFILCAFLILSICGCIVVYYWCGRTKVQQSFQTDIDQISNI